MTLVVVLKEHDVYLGQPLIDAARMEHSQGIIGASFTSSFVNQIVPPKYLVPFEQHLKKMEAIYSKETSSTGQGTGGQRGELTSAHSSGRLPRIQQKRTFTTNTFSLIDASDAREAAFDSPEGGSEQPILKS